MVLALNGHITTAANQLDISIIVSGCLRAVIDVHKTLV